MKRIFMLLAVVLSVFCLGSAALAEGFKLDADLTMTSPNEDFHDYDAAFVGLNGECDLGSFVIGGTALVAVYRDPAFLDHEEGLTYFYDVYGGYKLLDDDSLRLAVLAGYFNFNQDYSNSDAALKVTWQDSSIAVGLKATAALDPIGLSLAYFYGVSNESNAVVNGIDNEYADPGFSLIELKAAYAFNDSWDIHLVYRNFNFVGHDYQPGHGVVDGDVGYSGFGLGVTYAF